MNKKKFVLLLIAGLLVGAFSGMLFENVGLTELGKSIKFFLIKNVFAIVISVMIVSILISYVFYRKSKIEIEKGLEGEDPIPTKYTNISLMVRDISIFIIFGLGSMWGMSMGVYSPESWINLREMVILIASLIVYIILISVIFQKNYEFIQKIEPNRKTDTLDLKFNKKFIEESDEMKKSEYYEKGYKGYQAIILTNFIMLVVLAGLSYYTDVGILAPILIAISSIIGIIASR
ncbi:DUF3169 family protein [Anaerococcus urinomassiliensis]|uniref:DUF3169 family protein n=1 Tax=Anaerococcus urinomassiliensis TaxID=1745712 RepID=UPI00093B8A6A|nr:DUF3169 family protein [Anaerococcus urinomassiliensis]